MRIVSGTDTLLDTGDLAGSATRGAIVTADGCWQWEGSISSDGYATLNGRLIHRIVEEHARGPIDRGLVVDHRCHVAGECTLGRACPHRRCVNPDHLRRITNEENVKRGNWASASAEARRPKSLCVRGHRKAPGKGCTTCARDRRRDFKERWASKTGRSQ